MTDWLGKTDVPLFVSRIRLQKRKSLPRAVGEWALDSGGFTELNASGRWTVTAQEYVGMVRRWKDEIGNLAWAAAQDWMCEPFVLAKTGKSVHEHQELTTQNYLKLRALAPELPIVPVLQGWENDDYVRHRDQYGSHGVDLAALPLVGIGSVCRRQDTAQTERLLFRLACDGLKCHGFGFKVGGLTRCHDVLESADSLSWSYYARRNPHKRLPTCSHANCSSCLPFALRWRKRLLAKLQPRLDGVAVGR